MPRAQCPRPPGRHSPRQLLPAVPVGLVPTHSAICRLRWFLHELDPGWEPKARSLDRPSVQDEVAARIADNAGTVARLAANGPAPTQPNRHPPAQRGPAPDGPDPSPLASAGQSDAAPRGERRQRPRGSTRPQAPPVRRRLRSSTTRPRHQTRTTCSLTEELEIVPLGPRSFGLKPLSISWHWSIPLRRIRGGTRQPAAWHAQGRASRESHSRGGQCDSRRTLIFLVRRRPEGSRRVRRRAALWRSLSPP